jgi:hypothetical protein
VAFEKGFWAFGKPDALFLSQSAVELVQLLRFDNIYANRRLVSNTQKYFCERND